MGGFRRCMGSCGRGRGASNRYPYEWRLGLALTPSPSPKKGEGSHCQSLQAQKFMQRAVMAEKPEAVLNHFERLLESVLIGLSTAIAIVHVIRTNSVSVLRKIPLPRRGWCTLRQGKRTTPNPSKGGEQGQSVLISLATAIRAILQVPLPVGEGFRVRENGRGVKVKTCPNPVGNCYIKN